MAVSSRLNLADYETGAIRVLVAELYAIFHQREPDEGGLSGYVEQLKAGKPVADIISAFATSDEFEDRLRRRLLMAVSSRLSQVGPDASGDATDTMAALSAFPTDYRPPGEAGRCYLDRIRSGFLDRYCSGSLVLDVGFTGYDNPDRKAGLPNAIGIDLDYPGYDGIRLPFDDGTVDTVFSSHCLEHILFDHAAIRDWYRVLKVGGYMVCMVPSQALYEKRRFLPSWFNVDHKRMYTPSSLAGSFEVALETNSYRVRHLAENDKGFNYNLGPDMHSDGAYEIEIVIEKIEPPTWSLG